MSHSALMELWEPTRLTSLSAARQRVAFVRRLRIGMIILAGACLALFLVSATLRGAEREAQRPREMAVEDVVRMVNPRFSGRTANGEPYSVLAATALRRKGEPNIVDLVSPIMRDGKGGALSSTTGIYNAETRTIELTGKVNFNDKAGLSFETGKSVVLVTENRVVGGDISGQAQLGNIQANGYEVQDAGKTVEFKGGVRTRLNQGAPAASSASATAPKGAPNGKGGAPQ